jgi:Zn-dependent protease with chaperone function
VCTADDEAQGVFAHEMSHIDRVHSLQRLYQAAIVPAAIAFVTGDISQITQLATLLPGILVQAAYSRYSRDLEQQADDDAAAVLKRLGGDPAHLADLLDRMEKTLCGKQGCSSGWLGDHPETDFRALRLRNPSGAEKENSN